MKVTVKFCQGATEVNFTLVTRGRFLRVESKIPPLNAMFRFDADVKKTTVRHQRDFKPFEV